MDDLAWETLDTDIDYRCPGFDVRRDEVRFPDGETDGYHYVDEAPAVVVLPLTPDGDVVVIDEWRQAVGRVNRGLPAGSVEPEDADDLERAAARELAEETGYEADSFERLTTVEPTTESRTRFTITSSRRGVSPPPNRTSTTTNRSRSRRCRTTTCSKPSSTRGSATVGP